MSEQKEGGRNSLWADLTRRLRREPAGPVQPEGQGGAQSGRAAQDDARKRDPSFNPGDMPEAVQRRYYAQSSRWSGEPAYFSTPTSDKPAFRDRGDRLVTDNDSRELVKDLVAVAEHRSWDRIQVAGSETFRRAVWLEAAERGIAVRGYKPTERDLQELDRVRTDKARNSIAPAVDKDRDAGALRANNREPGQGREAAPAESPGQTRAAAPELPQPRTRSLPAPAEGYSRPSSQALDRAVGVVAIRAGIDPETARAANSAYAAADWAWSYADHRDDRARGQQSVDKAMQAMNSFAGKSRAHAEIASAIADNHYYDMALVGPWYVARGDRDPMLVRELADQKRLHAPDAGREQNTRSPGFASEAEREHVKSVADDTKRNERAARSQIRAMDVVVRRALGSSPEAAERIMAIAREQIADQLGEGRDIKAARVRAGPEREADASAARRQPSTSRQRPTPASPQREHRPPERQRGR